jgi:NADP-dependent 3-hydroxy acid dehydrogenase YdfG
MVAPVPPSLLFLTETFLPSRARLFRRGDRVTLWPESGKVKRVTCAFAPAAGTGGCSAVRERERNEGSDEMGSLEGKVALVTGASRGIGAAVAHGLAKEGVRLGLASRSGDDLGIPGAVARATDVRDPDAVERIVAATTDAFGRLDIVVANAGVGAYGPFLELPPAHLDEMIDVNVKGTLYTVRAALPQLLRSDAADVVTLASEAGRRGLPFEAVYCASKFAQVGFTRSLDHELREHGIRCTNVCPGGVATDFAMGRGRTSDMPALEGMMTSTDVAEAVLFVLTRPRNHRILEVAFRPMSEESWG